MQYNRTNKLFKLGKQYQLWKPNNKRISKSTMKIVEKETQEREDRVLNKRVAIHLKYNS